MNTTQQDIEIFEQAMAREMTCIWRYADDRIVVERLDKNTWETLDYTEFKSRHVESFVECHGADKRKYIGAEALMRAQAAYRQE